MQYSKYFINPIKNQYLNFKGRSTRTEYWLFELFYLLTFVALYLVEMLIGLPLVLTTIFWLATIIPALAFEFRRFNDSGFSPWWILLYLVPIFGWIAVIVMHCQKSKN